ncbi:MAG: DUF3144 domain-containing protein [Rhizobiales bacterium]|nr:DUF3144 domain-containing protein [Hyphomicrobiales bacterium]
MTETNDGEPERNISPEQFMNIADKFINVANRTNQRVPAVDLHMAFLYAATRYSAHVCKNVLEVQDQEEFVSEMTKSFQEMLRNHLADPSV